MAIVTELKELPVRCDFYITEEVSETLYNTLRREIDAKLKEISEIHINNEKWYRNNDIDPKLYQRKSVEFIIHLSTFGGSCYDGLGIYDLLYNLDHNPDVKITLICEGKIMSCGILIMCAINDRKGTRNSNYMIHQIMSMTMWKLETMKEDVKEFERLENVIDNIILSNTKITREQLNDWYSHKKDFYFDAKTALELGLINEII